MLSTASPKKKISSNQLMKKVIAHWILLLLAGSCALAEEDDDPFCESGEANTPKVVRVQVEYVEMSHEDLTKLLFLDKPESLDATNLRKTVQAMVEKKQAKIIDTQMVTMPSGEKSTSDSRHEFIYPTEYEGPASADDIKKAIEQAPAFPSNPATPTAFETRNVGSSLEAEVAVDAENRLVDFRVRTEFIWYTGDVVWQEWKVKKGKRLTVKMPNFYTVEVDGSGFSVSGKYYLFSVVSPKDVKGAVDVDRKVMIFVKCDVMEAK